MVIFNVFAEIIIILTKILSLSAPRCGSTCARYLNGKFFKILTLITVFFLISTSSSSVANSSEPCPGCFGKKAKLYFDQFKIYIQNTDYSYNNFDRCVRSRGFNSVPQPSRSSNCSTNSCNCSNSSISYSHFANSRGTNTRFFIIIVSRA